MVDARNMSADVDRCYDLIAARGDGDSDGAKTGLEFFIDDGVAVFADLEDGFLDLRHARHSFWAKDFGLSVVK